MIKFDINKNESFKYYRSDRNWLTHGTIIKKSINRNKFNNIVLRYSETIKYIKIKTYFS